VYAQDLRGRGFVPPVLDVVQLWSQIQAAPILSLGAARVKMSESVFQDLCHLRETVCSNLFCDGQQLHGVDAPDQLFGDRVQLGDKSAGLEFRIQIWSREGDAEW
jgi:hypothetical protein